MKIKIDSGPESVTKRMVITPDETQVFDLNSIESMTYGEYGGSYWGDGISGTLIYFKNGTKLLVEKLTPKEIYKLGVLEEQLK